MNTIMAKQTTMLQNIRANNIEIKALLQQLTEQVADLHRKLDNPPPQPRSAMPTQIHAAVPPKQVAPLPPLISYAPPKSTLPISASPAPENLSPETSHFHPLQSELANNLQPNPAELHIGDSDQNGEKFQPPNNSGTLSQQSHSSSIERKSAFGDARNLFEKMGSETFQSPLEMSINRLETVNNNVPLVYHLTVGMKMQFGCQNPFAWIEQYGQKLFDVMLERDAREIFERTIYIFDPGVFADASTVFAERNKFRGKSKIFIFDPGGTLAVERVSDLEDKVDLEGVGNDITCDTATTNSDACVPRRLLD